jgi:5-formyltetrahydrofolate cyclo-ligase
MRDAQAGAVRAKRELRAALLARRATRPDAERAAATVALLEHLLDGLNERGIDSVAAYVPIGSEPGVGTGPVLPGALRAAGLRVLLPVTAPHRTLGWAEYGSPDGLGDGRYGLREPTGPRLPPDALRTVDAILVPALAVDDAGRRLGRGAGYYDRALPATGATPAGPALIAVVYDDEILAEVPVEPHDATMTAVLSPRRGWREVPGSGR